MRYSEEQKLNPACQDSDFAYRCRIRYISRKISKRKRASCDRGQSALFHGMIHEYPREADRYKRFIANPQVRCETNMHRMSHPIYRVVSFEIVGPHRIKVRFNDETTQDIDFRPVLEGELFGPLVDEVLFNQVRIDSEVHTLVWPNGADFDPATLHDWPAHEEELRKMAGRWSDALAANQRG